PLIEASDNSFEKHDVDATITKLPSIPIRKAGRSRENPKIRFVYAEVKNSFKALNWDMPSRRIVKYFPASLIGEVTQEDNRGHEMPRVRHLDSSPRSMSTERELEDEGIIGNKTGQYIDQSLSNEALVLDNDGDLPELMGSWRDR